MLVYADWRRYSLFPTAPRSLYSGPPRTKPPFVAITRSSEYGMQGLADQLLVRMRPVDIRGLDKRHAFSDHLAEEGDRAVMVGVLAPDLGPGQLHRAVADRSDA